MKLKQCFNYFRLALSVYVDKQALRLPLGLLWVLIEEIEDRERQTERHRDRDREFERDRDREFE